MNPRIVKFPASLARMPSDIFGVDPDAFPCPLIKEFDRLYLDCLTIYQHALQNAIESDARYVEAIKPAYSAVGQLVGIGAGVAVSYPCLKAVTWILSIQCPVVATVSICSLPALALGYLGKKMGEEIAELESPNLESLLEKIVELEKKRMLHMSTQVKSYLLDRSEKQIQALILNPHHQVAQADIRTYQKLKEISDKIDEINLASCSNSQEEI